MSNISPLVADLPNCVTAVEAVEVAQRLAGEATLTTSTLRAELGALRKNSDIDVDELAELIVRKEAAVGIAERRESEAIRTASIAAQGVRRAEATALASEQGVRRMVHAAIVDDAELLARAQTARAEFEATLADLSRLRQVVRQAVNAEAARNRMLVGDDPVDPIGQCQQALASSMQAVKPLPSAVQTAIARHVAGQPEYRDLTHWAVAPSELDEGTVASIERRLPNRRIIEQWKGTSPEGDRRPRRTLVEASLADTGHAPAKASNRRRNVAV